jgi:hypothetical protein
VSRRSASRSFMSQTASRAGAHGAGDPK